ncbi:MAG: thiamine diphosphokinase [Eubacteriales bacterium]|nr:thiamine diphosphokinase [Eubacteriales bacterium]
MDSGRRCVIVGGAGINDYELIRVYLRDNDYVIYCDSGLKHLEGLKALPGLIVGDFDSHENPHMDVETIVLPTVKDDTDTVYAVKEGIKRGFDEFLLVGVIGARLDHTLGNLSILLYLDSLGKKGLIVDDYSEMEIVGERPVSISERFPFFSLLNITGKARGISITGAKYNLEDAEITTKYQYGVSNEVTPGGEAVVSVGDGSLLLIKDFRG